MPKSRPEPVGPEAPSLSVSERPIRFASIALTACAALLIAWSILDFAQAPAWLIGPAAGAALPFWLWRAGARGVADAIAQVPAGTLWLLPALGAMWWLHDQSYDGAHYHLPSVLALRDGWHPAWSKTGLIWTDSYPHGMWMLYAAIAGVTSHIEAGRIVNALFALCAFYSLLHLLAVALTQTPRRLRTALAALCALNPIVVGQMLTHMVDGAVATLTLCLAVFMAISHGQNWRSWAVRGAAASAVLLVNAKT